MLILFFTIIFIAELIVLEKIISSISKFQKQIVDCNSQVKECRTKIKSSIGIFRTFTQNILSKLNCFVTFVVEKRINCSENIQKNILIKLLAFILRLRMKRIWTVINIFFSIRKFLKAL
jgi:hypothetical protein